MRTRPQLIPWILTFAITGAAVVLRFVQLLLFTDSSTGRVTAAGAPLSYGLYALLLCAGVCCTVCALHQSHTAVAVAANGGSRRLTAAFCATTWRTVRFIYSGMTWSAKG